MERNKQKLGETEKNWKKQEQNTNKKTRRNKEKKHNKINKIVHVPKMQHNTTKIYFNWYMSYNIFLLLIVIRISI